MGALKFGISHGVRNTGKYWRNLWQTNKRDFALYAGVEVVKIYIVYRVGRWLLREIQ